MFSLEIGQLKIAQKLRSNVDDYWIIGHTYILSFATKAHFKNSFCPDESYEWTEPTRTRKALLKLNHRWIFEQSAAKATRISSEASFSSNRPHCLKSFRICTSTTSRSGEVSREKDTCTPDTCLLVDPQERDLRKAWIFVVWKIYLLRSKIINNRNIVRLSIFW